MTKMSADFRVDTGFWFKLGIILHITPHCSPRGGAAQLAQQQTGGPHKRFPAAAASLHAAAAARGFEQLHAALDT
jgi:hypothetical protein